MAWKGWREIIENRIYERIEIARAKIKELNELIERLEDIRQSIQKAPFQDATWDESGYEEYANEISRTVDMYFCDLYNSIPLRDGSSYHLCDCYVCPIDTCAYMPTIKRVMSCYSEKVDIDSECQRCSLIRYCSHY